MSLPLAVAIQSLRTSGSRAFIPFLTAGFPDVETFRMLLRCSRAADFIEVGLPFSDPIADGPSICYASEVALAQGMHTDLLFDVLADENNLPPIVIMTYLNPVLAYGPRKFMRRAADSGVRGIILTDVPPEDADAVLGEAQSNGIASVLLVAPTTPQERMAKIAAQATGFLYCVAVTGTTGARLRLGSQAQETIARLRTVTSIPAVVGFGISTPAHVRSTCEYADGVVVGSALVDIVRQHAGTTNLVEIFTATIRDLAQAAHQRSETA